jgi:hypothetical protein
MKALLSLWLCISLLTAAAMAQSSGEKDVASPENLFARSNKVQSLRKSKDVAGLKSLLTPDFQNVGSEGKLHRLSEFMDDVHDGALRDFQTYDFGMVAIDSGTALVTYNIVVSMVEGDDVLSPRYQKISDLWIRQGDDWRLKFEQATPLRPVD